VLVNLLMLEITPDEADLLLAPPAEKPLPRRGRAETVGGACRRNPRTRNRVGSPLDRRGVHLTPILYYTYPHEGYSLWTARRRYHLWQ
jgi:hypothetical protein